MWQLLRTALDLLRELKTMGTMPRGYPQVTALLYLSPYLDPLSIALSIALSI